MRCSAAVFVEAGRTFRTLHRAILPVLLCTFLNSYRSFGFRFIQYSYLTNEFGLSDVEAGAYIGIESWLKTVFGLLGAVAVDAVGVRRLALFALTIAAVGRALLAFGTTRTTLLAAIVGFTPAGEALLSTGLYRVALKKLTTRRNRALAFALEYATFNLSGALADVTVDALRARGDVAALGRRWSPLRQMTFCTWIAVLLSWLVVALFLFDKRVPDPEADDLDAIAVDGVGDGGAQSAVQSAAQRAADRATTRLGRCYARLKPSVEVVRLRAFWRALAFTASVFLISKQWGDLDSILAPYLERHFGEDVPIYTIHSINLWMCLPGPPLAAALTSHLETFTVVLPGLWVMALSPLYLVVAPSVPSAALWVVTLSLGEVFWSPRNYAFIAGIAPNGQEGLFLALLSLKDLFTSIPSSALNGWLNEALYVVWAAPTLALECRDRVGHFCEVAVAFANESLGVVNGSACATRGGAVCVGEGFSTLLSSNSSAADASLTCPQPGCNGCPGWTGPETASTLWLTVLLMSVTSPLAIMCCLPFLRGERDYCPRAARLLGRQGGRAAPQRAQPRIIELPAARASSCEPDGHGVSEPAATQK